MKSEKTDLLPPIRILYYGVVFVAVSWIAYVFYFSYIGVETLEDAAHFGDMFGGLNAAFAGLAFVGLLATIRYQHRELMDSRADAEDLKKSVEQMTKAMIAQAMALGNQARYLGEQNNLLREQNENTKRTEYLTALIARIDSYDKMIEWKKEIGGFIGPIRKDQELTIGELDQILDFVRDRESKNYDMD